jgi:hypothetical protein
VLALRPVAPRRDGNVQAPTDLRQPTAGDPVLRRELLDRLGPYQLVEFLAMEFGRSRDGHRPSQPARGSGRRHGYPAASVSTIRLSRTVDGGRGCGFPVARRSGPSRTSGQSRESPRGWVEAQTSTRLGERQFGASDAVLGFSAWCRAAIHAPGFLAVGHGRPPTVSSREPLARERSVAFLATSDLQRRWCSSVRWPIRTAMVEPAGAHCQGGQERADAGLLGSSWILAVVRAG